MKTKPIGPFLGINNRLPDFALRVETRQVAGNYLRLASNIDIDNAGHIRRREAESLIQAMAAPHSMMMTSATAGYVVRDSVMYAVTLPSYTETLFKTLASNGPVSWCAVGDDLYFSNGADSGRINAGTAYALGLQTPNSPACASIAGTIPRGLYQVALSYANSVTGEEGGISVSSSHSLSVDGGIAVDLPGASPGATHVNVYVSAANGSIPMLARSVAIGAASTSFSATPSAGREVTGRHEAPLPAGTLFMSNGRLCSFNGNIVYVGLPFRPGYYLPAEGYIPFPKPVSIAIENQGGTYIAADKTYWVPGDLGDVKDTIATVLPYGAVPGTSFSTPDKSTVGWFGADGFVLGATSGEVDAVMSDNISLTPPISGCATIRETNGYRRVVAADWCLNLDRLSATQYTGFGFTSISGEYGTKPDGIYSLTGGLVDSSFNLGLINFGSEELKQLPAVYIGSSSGSPMLLRVHEPDADYEYLARSSSEDMRIHRIDPGKGLRSSWFDLSISNTDGSDFILSSVSFAPVASGRRI